jgi:hypothetical protein
MARYGIEDTSRHLTLGVGSVDFDRAGAREDFD